MKKYKYLLIALVFIVTGVLIPSLWNNCDYAVIYTKAVKESTDVYDIYMYTMERNLNLYLIIIKCGIMSGLLTFGIKLIKNK